MRNISKVIKSYEPLMHNLLRKFHIKRDYEDNLQELRIILWKTVTKYKTERQEAKFFTYVYQALANKLKDILKSEYGVTCNKEELNKISADSKIFYYLKNPMHYLKLPVYEQWTLMSDSSSMEEVRLKEDFQQFCKLQSREERKILQLKASGFNEKEVAKTTGLSQTTINRRLNRLKKDFKKFMIEGE